MARADIHDLRIHHDDIVMPLVRQWRLIELEGLDDGASEPAKSSPVPVRDGGSAGL